MEQKLQGYDAYTEALFAPEDDVLRAVRAETQRAGLPEINVSASEGKLLHVLTLMRGARRILEIGTLGGYSAIWLARALPADGKLISLEIDAHHADVARANVKRAGLENRVEVRVGPALGSLSRMQADGEAPFDLVFIDADKDGYADYLEMAAPLLREGGWLLADNTLPDAVLNTEETSGAKRYNAAVAGRCDFVSIIVPQARDGGIDGLTISIKTSQGG